SGAVLKDIWNSPLSYGAMNDDSSVPKIISPRMKAATAMAMMLFLWSSAQPMALWYLSADLSNQPLNFSSHRAIPFRPPCICMEGSCQREESIGSRVNETKSETSTAKATLMPNW